MSASDAYADVVELCALLQCLGFTVKSLDSSDCNMSQDEGSRIVTINCQTSGFRVVLETASHACSCPASNQQNSGVWEVSGVAGGKQLNKETGSSLFKSLSKGHRERLSKELYEIIRCIKDSDDDKKVKEDNKSASMTELKTPDKLLSNIKAETPTRYRSLDTLTSSKEQHLPTPGALRAKLLSECENSDKKMCSRQSTYTVSSTPGSVRRRNKTSSPIQAPAQNMLERLLAAERAAEELRNNLACVIREHVREFVEKDDSSLSSLALDVSRISIMKAAETTKSQFASSPNLCRIAREETKSRLKRFESASTSNLSLKSQPKESKMSRLKRLSPNIFKRKESPATKDDVMRSQGGKSKLSSLIKAKIAVPVHVNKSPKSTEPSPNISSSRKKYSHIKSTIPRPSKKE